MAQDIFVIKTMGDALRNTGYKNIDSAISEIVDNSVQANASNVFVIISQGLDPDSGRKTVNEIAFLDDGEGMDTEGLSKCLGIGFSTRQDRRGIGRFGVGLPQASLYACPRVEVFSWQNGYQNCRKVFLDINKVKSGEQTEIDNPKLEKIPSIYARYLKLKASVDNGVKSYDFSEHGTFVIWKDCDRVNPRTITALTKRLKFSIGQKFRYFIDQDKCRIKLIDAECLDNSCDIMQNDPLFLMNPNYVLGNSERPGSIEPGNNVDYTEPLFEPYTNEDCSDGVVNVPVKYRDTNTRELKESNVKLRFSIVKSVFYDQTALSKDPGNTDMGKYARKLEGISIVRAGREIDFGQFGFYSNINSPVDRWWGCEISFEPELDETFGVANNKQHVELYANEDVDCDDDVIKPVWEILSKKITSTIKEMRKANAKKRQDSRKAQDVGLPVENIIDSAEDKEAEDPNSATTEIKQKMPECELKKKNMDELKKEGVEEPTDVDLENFMKKKVHFRKDNLGKFNALFDYSFELGSCMITFNMQHIFYSTFLEKLFEDKESEKAFDLFIASLVKAIDDTQNTQQEQDEKLLEVWNNKIKKYIEEWQSFAK
jgi:hypothetical protein